MRFFRFCGFAVLIGVLLAGAAYALDTKVEAETFTVANNANTRTNTQASGGSDVIFWGTTATGGSTATKTFSGAATKIILRADGDQCKGAPILKVYVDSTLKGQATVSNTVYKDLPVTLSGVSSGSHTLKVAYENDFAQGKCDRNVALDYVTITTPDTPADTTPPNTTITSGPAEGSSQTSTTASFGFTSSESPATFECKLDSGSYAACTSPITYDDIAVGNHTFSVRAYDISGNVDATPATRNFIIAPQPAPDRDSDTVPDSQDNCPDNANTSQTDTDGDGIGDACDTTPPPADVTTTYEAETFSVTGGTIRTGVTASGNSDVAFFNNGSAQKAHAGKISQIALTMRGHQCSPTAPQARVSVGSTVVQTINVTATTYTVYNVSVSDLEGDVKVEFINDGAAAPCDLNLFFDKAAITSDPQQPPPPPSTDNPFSYDTFFVDPNHEAWTTINSWSSSRPTDAAQLKKIAQAPQAPFYFEEWTEDPGNDGIAFYVEHFAKVYNADGSLPVLGAYAIPHRDCGSYSGGGFDTATEYENWIDGFRTGVENYIADANYENRVIVILEPDSLAGMGCLTTQQDINERYSLLSYAVTELEAAGANVYMDGGHSAWQTAEEQARRLNAANIAGATGFFSNNANFNFTADEIRYDTEISGKVGGKHFVIDTSRNGNGLYLGPQPHSGGCPEWANPPGRALGERPTANTGNSLVDAYFWLKYPGDSDADCGIYSSYPAGQFVPDMADGTYGADAYDALGLAKRAAW